MICPFFPEPTYFLFSHDVPSLLYYAQIPGTIIALILSFYIFWNGRHFLLNRLLLAICLCFSIWTVINLITWTNIHSDIIMFSWSFFGLIFSLISIFCIYFIYVYIDKKDISDRIKIILLALFVPVALITPTSFNISGFDLTNCDAFKFEKLSFEIYYTLLGIIAIIWILVLLIHRYRTSASNSLKKEIFLMGAGIELFLFSFFVIVFLASYLTKIGIFQDSDLELYGLFGMVIFMIYISILVVQFKTFNIKPLATQALVWGLAILIGSQFFFVKTTVNFILVSITFSGSVILGFFFFFSVKKEVKQREELAELNLKLNDLIKQRENLVHLVTHKVKGSFTRSKYMFAGILDGTFGETSPEIKKVAEQGLESDNMGIETVDLVLNVANMQKGTVKYDMKPLNLREIVEKSMNEKKVVALAKGLVIQNNISDGDYKILADAFWIKEAINNLLENSIKYTKTGSITVGLQNQNKKVLVSVKDTGVGITPEDKKNLFTEGGRGKDSVKVNVDSTGYGLYSVKLIIDAHKGKVWAESEGPDKGSTFYIELDAA